MKTTTLYIPMPNGYRLAVYPQHSDGFALEVKIGGEWYIDHDDEAPLAPTDEQIVATMRQWAGRLISLAGRYESAVPA